MEKTQTIPKTAIKAKKFSLDLKWTMIFSAVLGAILFIAVYGVRILDPTYDEWLFAGGDLTQHYIGWIFYRECDWHFPLGITDGLLGDLKTTIVYTDSFPLMAIFFKILSPILPHPFQFHGLMGLMIFMLNGASSSLLIHKFNKNPFFCIGGSVFFILSPPVMQRLYGHETLACHYFIILAFCLWAYQDHKWQKKWQTYAMPPILWSLLGMAAVGTHMYFIPMIYLVMLGCFITDIFQYKKIIRPISCFTSTTALSLLMMWVIGAFYGKGDSSTMGLGDCSANLNTYYNPIQLGEGGLIGDYSKASQFLAPRPKGAFQYEGFAYLGLGVLFALLLALVILFTVLEKKGGNPLKQLGSMIYKRRFLLISCVIIFIFSMFLALSPKAMIDDKELYSIKYPEKIENLLATFRASGRFAWIGQYMIFTGILCALSRLDGKKTSLAVLLLCLGIQTADISDQLHSRSWYKKYQAHESRLQDPRWDILAEGCDKFVGLPYDQSEGIIYDFTQFAYEKNMTINHFHVARPDLNGIIEQYYRNIDAIANGKADPNALYVFLSEEYIPEAEGLKVYELDGFYVVKCPGQNDPLAQ